MKGFAFGLGAAIAACLVAIVSVLVFGGQKLPAMIYLPVGGVAIVGLGWGGIHLARSQPATRKESR